MPDPELTHSRDQRDHGRGGRRGRNSEFPFDFYNDDYWYDYDDGGRGPGGGFLAWGNDELDRLLAGNGSSGRRETMYYGIGGGGGSSAGGVGEDVRSGALGLIGGRRKRSAVTPHDGGPDPTVIPHTSMFGFLSRFPWWKRSTLRYRPSAADLQEHPGMPREFPNYTDDESEQHRANSPHRGGRGGGSAGAGAAGPSSSRAQFGRNRSHTNSSGTSGESFRSRGDLFPSDGEDDAVPLGDEFSIVLRGSGGSDGELSTRRLKRGSSFRGRNHSIVSHDTSYHDEYSDDHHHDNHNGDDGYDDDNDNDNDGPRTFRCHPSRDPVDDSILRTQEAELAAEEERDIGRKREQARRIAFERGLSNQPPPATAPRSSSSPPRSPRHPHTGVGGEGGAGRMGMLSPTSLPTSPRAMPHTNHNHPHPRSANSMSPPLQPHEPMQFHVAAAAAAALVRPMSPISPLGGSPRTLSPRAMSPEPVLSGRTSRRDGRVDVGLSPAQKGQTQAQAKGPIQGQAQAQPQPLSILPHATVDIVIEGTISPGNTTPSPRGDGDGDRDGDMIPGDEEE